MPLIMTTAPMAIDDDNTLTFHMRCKSMDLLALQQEIQQFTLSMQSFFDSLIASTGETAPWTQQRIKPIIVA